MEAPRAFFEQPHYPHHRYPGIYDDIIRPSHSGGPLSPGGIDFNSHPRSPRRSYSINTHDFMHRDREPWQQMAHTYAWVLDQEIAEMSRKNDETVRWVYEQRVHEQQEHDIMWKQMMRARGLQKLMSTFDSESKPKRRNTNLPAGLRWPRETENMMEEELWRLQASRREAERCRLEYKKRKAQDEARAREQKEEQKRARAVRDEADRRAWQTYEDRWAALTSTTDSSEDLTFRSIPWPTFTSPRSANDITPTRIAMFVLSPFHSNAQSRKDRIRSALRRWHPDRFGRLLARVAEQDKAGVEEAVGVIVRCLNNLLEKEN